MSINLFIVSFITFWVILGAIWAIGKWFKIRFFTKDRFLTVLPISSISSASYQNIFSTFWNTAGDYLIIIMVLFMAMVISLVVYRWFKSDDRDID